MNRLVFPIEIDLRSCIMPAAGMLWGRRDAGSPAYDEAIAAADPLDCDRFFAREFVGLNRARDAAGLARQLGVMLRAAHALKRRTDALAGLRDLGMVTAALTRCGGALPHEAAQRLARLGRIAGEVPRDTIFSYGPRNPAGARERSFTTTTDERAFIDSFRQGAAAIGAAIRALRSAYELQLDDEALPLQIGEATGAVRRVVDIMVAVRCQVRPDVFTAEIRPFFEPIEVDGREYVAPGGAQLPLWAVDMMVWADRVPQIQLYRYLRENVDYYPRYYRRLITDLEGRPSLLMRVSGRRPISLPVARALDELIAQLERFRFPHRKVTAENMALRSYGAYQSDVLDQLLKLTMAARTRVKTLVSRAAFKGGDNGKKMPGSVEVQQR
jgi:hypothetical protein